MSSSTYQIRRGQLEDYFDRTAAHAWEKLTSDAPVSRIRATVRAGRDRMRATLLSWLPDDLSGARLLDAGCGTGALAGEAAKRGADVTAIDLSSNLIALARDRAPTDLGEGSIDFQVGDMLDPRGRGFDYVVAMDSLIHYSADDMVAALDRIAPAATRKILFTRAPRTVPLTLMHALGRLFPRSDRAPAIQPVATRHLKRKLTVARELEDWSLGRDHRITSGFYMSHAQELIRG
ncbi:MAG: magnesium protoporphyrin IX methyltransferase [Geminicoccaceae bacterium]